MLCSGKFSFCGSTLRWRFGLVCSFSCLLAQSASAQFPTTVQLPTVTSFSVNTSVSVPDSGGAYTDAMRRRTMGQQLPYSPLNRRLLNPIQRPVTAGLSAKDSTTANAEQGTPQDREAHSRYAAASRNQVSTNPAAALRARQREAKAQLDAINKSLADGRKAAAAGRFGTARVYFNHAAKRATGSLREVALAELKMLEGQELAQQAARVTR